MSLPSITYTPTGGGPVTFNFQDGPKDFIAYDSARRNDNVSTSGLRESVYEATDLMIAFTMPAILMASGGAYASWKNFYAACLQGIPFQFTPNPAVTAAAAPWSGGTFWFNCLIEDTKFQPKRVGYYRYSLDCKFRVVLDGQAPANAGMIMEAFLGISPT